MAIELRKPGTIDLTKTDKPMPHEIILYKTRQPVTSALLMLAFAAGAEVSLWDRNSYSWITGRITAITLESGYKRGDRPTSFLVTITNDEGEFVPGLWVKTEG